MKDRQNPNLLIYGDKLKRKDLELIIKKFYNDIGCNVSKITWNNVTGLPTISGFRRSNIKKV